MTVPARQQQQKASVDELYDSDAEQEALARLIEPRYVAALNATHELIEATFPTMESFRLDDAATRHVLATAAEQVVRIDETTRAALREMMQIGQQRGYSNWEIANGVAKDNYRGIEGLFKETWKGRANTVARNEIGQAQHVAAADRYAATGLVDRVQLRDGTGAHPDVQCGGRNGDTVTVPPYPQRLHINCTLVMVPLLRERARIDTSRFPSNPSVPELQDWANAKWSNVQFDLDGMHKDMAVPTLKEFDSLAKQWPEVVERLKYFGTYKNAPPGTGEGFARAGYGEVYGFANLTTGTYLGLNPKWYGDPAKFLDSLASGGVSRRWVDGVLVTQQGRKDAFHDGMTQPESVVRHEFGHLLDGYLKAGAGDTQGHYHPILSRGIHADGFGLIRDTKDAWETAHKATPKVSGYGKTNPLEAWAEAFSAQQYGSPSVKRMKYVIDQKALLDEIRIALNKPSVDDIPWFERGQSDEVIQRITAERRALERRIGV